MATDKISRRNLALRGADNIWLAGPVEGLDAADVRARLVALGRRPEARQAALLRRLDPMSDTYRVVSEAEWAEFVSGLVVEFDGPAWGDDVTLEIVADREQATPLEGRPFRLGVGPGWITFRFNHSLGDSTALWPAFMALTHAPTLFETFPMHQPTGLKPLGRALRHTFGRRPRSLLDVVRSDRAAMPVEGSSPRDVAPWARSVYAVSEPGFKRSVRDADGRGLAFSALLVARTHRAAADLGVALHPGVAMVVDCRRYLPDATEYLDGNFIGGSYLAFADPTDAAEIDAGITALVDSGRPLLAMSLSAAGMRRGPIVDHVTVPDPQGRSLLSLSHVGRLPWPDGGHAPELMTAMSRAVGDHGISIITVETEKVMTAAVTWADGFQDPATMKRLAEAVVGR